MRTTSEGKSVSDTKTMFEVFRERSKYAIEEQVAEAERCLRIAESYLSTDTRGEALQNRIAHRHEVRAENRHQELIAMHEETRGKLMAILDWIDNS